jgi:hypothetical protein
MFQESSPHRSASEEGTRLPRSGISPSPSQKERGAHVDSSKRAAQKLEVKESDVTLEIDPATCSFTLSHSWEVRGATREELLAAARHLTITGAETGVMRSAQIATRTPVSEQKNEDGASADGVRLRFLPGLLGARVSIQRTESGLTASLSGGPVGIGNLKVDFGETYVGKDGRPVTPVVENGKSTFSLNGRFGSFLTRAVLFCNPLTKAIMRKALELIAEFHVKSFNPTEALENILERKGNPSK